VSAADANLGRHAVVFRDEVADLGLDPEGRVVELAEVVPHVAEQRVRRAEDERVLRTGARRAAEMQIRRQQRGEPLEVSAANRLEVVAHEALVHDGVGHRVKLLRSDYAMPSAF
jgi:hypothetical protein